jgi:Na+-driven multidrug efflux pump
VTNTTIKQSQYLQAAKYAVSDKIQAYSIVFSDLMSTFWAQICSCSVFLFSSCFLYSFGFFTFIIYVFLEFVGGMLLGRTLSILLTMTIGTSMAARQGPTAMAAHQICLQVWLAVSLLADALAVSAQVCIFSF